MQGEKLGFIGVGQLAQPMVKHLLEQGYEVLVHNGRRDPLKKVHIQRSHLLSVP
jgi:3-hydroxyisobutyrate dehydrogenase-like beta-hydroxyacid dehydrogenase